MTGWKLVFLSVAVAALMLQDTASAVPDFCTLEPDRGPCFAHIPSYHFNSATGQCDVFRYGGCIGNENRFSQLEDCYRTCGDPCSLIDCAPGTTCRVKEDTGAGECIKDICALEPDPGPCRASIPSYFFNFKSSQCEEFIYGGCEGNENRFSLLEYCLETCGVTEPTENPCNLIDCAPGTTCRVKEDTGAGECIKDICALVPDPGPCRASIPSYFFNFKSSQCEEFIYGGCEGNENRFSLLEYCLETCGVTEPTENPCNLIDCAPGTTCRVKEDTGAGECIKDICALVPDPGPCRASIPSYFFNFKSSQCEEFIYGGCEGNENRFSLLEYCLETCGVTEPTENPCNLIDCAPGTTCRVKEDTGAGECIKGTCALEPDPGPCNFFFPNYYFNYATGQCEILKYGGCGGNENRFTRREDCINTCGDPCSLIECAPGTKCHVNEETEAGECIKDICALEPDRGPCKAYFLSYFFNFASRQCEIFVYGGCKGNKNRFYLLEDCRKTCEAPASL